jgi:hypothetical protein
MHGCDDGAGFGDGEGDYILELAELELGADFFISGDDFLGTRDLLRRAKDGRLRGCTGGAVFGRHDVVDFGGGRWVVRVRLGMDTIGRMAEEKYRTLVLDGFVPQPSRMR